MIILGLETSCDETAAALLEIKNRRVNVLNNIVSSQVKIHQKYGGVVPEVAARKHLENIIPIIESVFRQAHFGFKKIDLIAVTIGPGLITSLIVGVETAKVLSYVWQKPVVPINHLIGHLYANWLPEKTGNLPKIKFPALVLLVSGGHSELILMKNYGQYKIIGQTLDDAAGEAFDKVAKLLNVGYPGGPAMEKAALKGNPLAIDLPRPLLEKNNFNFSFSGLKTAVLYKIKKGDKLIRPKGRQLYDYCASFEQAVVDVLVDKTIKAAQKYQVKTIMLAGGVAANRNLRKNLEEKIKKEMPAVKYLSPAIKYCTDNAAMVALAGYFQKNKKISWEKLKVNLDIGL